MYRNSQSVRPARTLPLSVLIALTLTLTACGGGDTSSPPADQSTPVASAAVPPTATSNSGEGDQPGVATATSAPATLPAVSGNGADWSKVDACTLLTQQELESAVGPIGADAAPDPDYSTAIDGRASCRFNDLKGAYRVLLAVGPPIMWDSEHGSAVLEGLDPQSFSGIGDEAFIAGRMLVARWQSKGVTIRLSLFNFETPFNPDQSAQLIQKAYERLP